MSLESVAGLVRGIQALVGLAESGARAIRNARLAAELAEIRVRMDSIRRRIDEELPVRGGATGDYARRSEARREELRAEGSSEIDASGPPVGSPAIVIPPDPYDEER